MLTLLIGHRGTGKSSFLKRLEHYHANTSAHSTSSVVLFFDLDILIEAQTQKSILQIFQEFGETEFRKLEIQQFLFFLKQNDWTTRDLILAVGAGFPLNLFIDSLKQTQFLWIRRETDNLGRIFLNRPRLKSTQTYQEEYQTLF